MIRDEAIGFRMGAGFAVALRNGKEGKEAFDMALTVVMRKGIPEQTEEFLQFQRDLVDGKADPQLLN